jgi:hypothetical protein
MRRIARWRQQVGLAVVVSALAAPAMAAPIVVPTVTPAGPLFHYDYSITNEVPGEDIILVTIAVPPMDATLTNLFAPQGFMALYDPVLGLVDFLPQLGSPALFAVGTTLGGFGFDSANPPVPGTFEAVTLSGAVLTGQTDAPGTPGVIPEPATMTLLALGLGALAGRRTVRARAARH